MYRLNKHFKHFTSTTNNKNLPVIVNNINNVLEFTLNRPKALNALNLEMIEIIQNNIKNLNKNDKAIILKGSGNKAFCAGGDVVAVTLAGRDGDRSDENNLSRTFFRDEYICDHTIASLNIPTIALMDGIVMGGGVGLSINCDYRIATSTSLFAMPEATIGFFCDVGGSYFLPRLPGKIGLYLALTGARLNGSELLEAGVASHYYDTTNKKNTLDYLINKISQSDCKTEDMVPLLDELCMNPKDIPSTFIKGCLISILVE